MTAVFCLLAGTYAAQTMKASAQDDMSIRVVTCDGKTATLTAPEGYDYVWFRATHDSTMAKIPNYWDSLPPEGTFRKDGSLKGKFSISATQKVHFSQGNLEYHVHDHRLRFAREQWYTSYIPLLFHGQRDDNGWTPYIPWDSIYAWSGNAEIENSTYGHEWFLMTRSEWEYLFYLRRNAVKKWGYGVINDLMCMIVLPDSWSCPAGLSFTPCEYTLEESRGEHFKNDHPTIHLLSGSGSSISQNRYTLEDWRQMEQAGAVAFPFSGFSSGGSINGYATYCDYWQATPYNDSFAYGSFISNGVMHLKSEFHRAPKYGFLVRMTRLTDDSPRDTIPTDLKQNGCLTKGGFSVAADRKVYFSQGNLQYQASTDTWRFADEQYDICGMDNRNASATYNGWIDLFAWGTSGWSGGVQNYHPWQRGTFPESNELYYAGGDERQSLTGDFANADWGVYNAISNGGNEPGLWRSLTANEMAYLLRWRPNAEQLRAYAVINGQPGLVLLPDDWQQPDGVLFKAGNAGPDAADVDTLFLDNRYGEKEWRRLENFGAVFLPLAGVTSGTTNISYSPTVGGLYWSSSASSTTSSATCLYFEESHSYLPSTGSGYRTHGMSVRLVTDSIGRLKTMNTEPELPEPAEPDTCITIDWNQMVRQTDYVKTSVAPCDSITTERRFTALKTTTMSTSLLKTEGFSAPIDHKVLVHVRFKSNFTNEPIFYYYNDNISRSVHSENYVRDEWCEIVTVIDGINLLSSYWSGNIAGKMVEGEYISLPEEGGMVFFDLTQMFGAGNEPTQEQFLERFPHVNYPFTDGELREICHFDVPDTLSLCPARSQPLKGALKGLFSVSDSKQVHFSQGNLQYQPSTKTWRFAGEQWETRGTDNNHPTVTSTQWLDLFAWGCSGYSKGITWNNPVRRGLFPRDTANFWIAGNWRLSMTGENAEVDWGVHNAIANGGNEAGLWRTMTRDEWNYLLFGRPDAAQRRAYAAIDGNIGLVLLPDEWTTPDGLAIITDNIGPDTTKVDSFFLDNRYTMAQWRRMEQAGAVFLPATGICSTSGQYSPTTGWYWSASACGSTMATCVHFNQTSSRHITNIGGCYRTHAIAVRLVIDRQKTDSIQWADNRLLRKYSSVKWNQALKDLNYDPGMLKPDHTVIGERRYIVLNTSSTPRRGIYTSGSTIPHGHKVFVHITFKSNFTETPCLWYYNGVEFLSLEPEKYVQDEWCKITGLIDGFEPGTITGFLPYGNNYYAGEYLSLPEEGGFVVFDLTRMFGSGLEPSEDEFMRLFPQDSYPYEKGREMQLCDVAVESQNDISALDHSAQYAYPAGRLSGMFSVSDTKQVHFSQGNLQYQPSTNTWRFAEHQYDVTGTQNNNPEATTTNWLDLFPFGTSGWSSGAEKYQPWQYALTEDRNEFAVNGVFHAMTGTWRQLDWGYNPIANGGNKGNLWRTMTDSEWRYLLKERPNAAQRLALATVCGVQGLLLLPDEWICPEGISVVCNHSQNYTTTGYAVNQAHFSDNTYDAALWQSLERAGAVFLPSEGTRTTNLFNSQEGGYYAASPSEDKSGIINSLHFSSMSSGVISAEYGWTPQIGLSVRLVVDKYTAEKAQNEYLAYDLTVPDSERFPLETIQGRCIPQVEQLENGRYKLTLTLHSGYPDVNELASFHMNFPWTVLEGHETDQLYVSFKYKRLQGRGDFSSFNWCGKKPVETLKNEDIDDYTYVLLQLPVISQNTPSIQYSPSYHYLDITSVYVNDVYEVWDIKLGGNPFKELEAAEKVAPHTPFTTTGIFSVGEGRQMVFSMGNLQYQASSGTWAFARQQYDVVGVRNQFISPDYTGWIDLFGWGTSGYDAMPKSLTLRNCHPWSDDTLKHDNNYNRNRYMYGPDAGGSSSITGENTMYDWGVYNRIANGGNVQGLWRTPRQDELLYVMGMRPDAGRLRAFAIVCGTKGVVLLPDSCVLPDGFPYRSSDVSRGYNSNIYSYAQWQVLERLGAMFLPATGSRLANQLEGPDPPDTGYYWTADEGAGSGSGSGSGGGSGSEGATTMSVVPCKGQAVRLATDVYSTEQQIVVPADGTSWYCRLSNAETSFVLGAKAIGPANSFEETAYDTLCFGDTIEWHGRLLTQAGTYTDSLLTIYGCDSVYTLYLTVLQPSDSIELASVCQGDAYTWHGMRFTNPTDTVDTLVNAVGCDSICTLRLTVLQPSDSVEQAAVCQGDAYTWHGMTFTTPTDTVDTLVNAVGCDSICTLRLTVLQPSDSVEQAEICDGDAYTWHGMTFTNPTDTVDTLINAVGCDSICTLRLTVNPSYAYTFNQTITERASYTWDGRTYTDAGTYVVPYTTVYGCDSIVTLALTVKPAVYDVLTYEQCADDPYVRFDMLAEEGLFHQWQFRFSNRAAEQYFRDTVVDASQTLVMIPNKARAGIYGVTVCPLFDRQVVDSLPLTFTLRYPSSVLDQHWDDFIGVLTHDYNGGYDFVGFQWYKDGQPLPGENHSYLYQPLEMGAAYSAMLQQKDGTSLMTCDLIAAHMAELSLYPTFLAPRQMIHLYSSEQMTVNIYNSAGALVFTTACTAGEHLLPAPGVTGVYVVTLQQSGGKGIQEMRKLLVR